VNAAVESPARLLDAITRGWGRRAQVKTSSLEDELAFDPARDDFLEALLPFAGHPLYRAVPPAMRSTVLTCGWLLYNQKTVAIETDLIAPACNALLAGLFESIATDLDRIALAETLVDEAYHVLLAVKVSQLTRERRSAPKPGTGFELVRRLRGLQGGLSPREAALCQVAVATVSELFISGYLAQLSACTSIQPVHQMSVASHRKDELAHARIFGTFAQRMVRELHGPELELFARTLADATAWFADPELDVWAGALQAIGFARWREMLGDCASHRGVAPPADFSALIAMAEETGLAQCAAFADRVQRHRAGAPTPAIPTLSRSVPA
jgi:alpha-N-dichloroacetyl-p-aminophenylserinol N-oxygenase